MTPTIGSIWYEDDKRYPIERRRAEVLAVEDGRVMILRASGLRTTVSLARFGKRRGYLERIP